MCFWKWHLTTDQATRGLYPFMFGSVKDFEPIVEKLIKVGTHVVSRRSPMAS